MSGVDSVSGSGGVHAGASGNEVPKPNVPGSGDVSHLRAAVENLCSEEGLNQSGCTVRPEDLVSGAGQSGDSQSAGMEAYVEGFIRQMLLDGLKKAGQPDSEGW